VHLAAIVESREHVCCRYRLQAFLPFLEKAGHQVTVYPRPRRLVGWWRLSRRLRPCDGVLLQRKLLAPWQLRILRKRGRFLVYDFDDAIVWRHSSRLGTRFSRRRRRLFSGVVRRADAVVAGNPALAQEVRHWRANHGVYVVPTCVDPNRYSLAEHRRCGPAAELVWIGSASTVHTLIKGKAMLEQLGQVRPQLRLKLICDQFPRLESMPVVECPWSEAGEAAALASADIGISWLPDDPWHRGKCGLKVLQYMASGLPVIASPVGIHTHLIRHGENGFLAETPAEWLAAVNHLVDDPALRQRMGQVGRRLVEQEYSVRQGAAHWLKILGEAQAARQTPSRAAA
jgi:glycosyltransferase involved in cell wall biosynthesis